MDDDESRLSDVRAYTQIRRYGDRQIQCNAHTDALRYTEKDAGDDGRRKGSLPKYREKYQFVCNMGVIWVESDKSQAGERQGIIVRNGVEIFKPAYSALPVRNKVHRRAQYVILGHTRTLH